jgi:hypothetical protein
MKRTSRRRGRGHLRGHGRGRHAPNIKRILLRFDPQKKDFLPAGRQFIAWESEVTIEREM